MSGFENRRKNYLHRFGYKDRIFPLIFPPLHHDIDTIVVIPAIGEKENLPALLDSLRVNSPESIAKSYILFVINNSTKHSNEIKENNFQTIQYLRSRKALPSRDVHYGFIDASTPGNELPLQESGVGFARKLGLDTALQLFNPNTQLKLLVCLDADCIVSASYLDRIRKAGTATEFNAAVIKYEHRIHDASGRNRDAIVLYELFLRYYVSGLKYAKSPYSFHTIGSTIVCTADVYMKVEGMNKRKAGEDFYFLEKIAKQFSVQNINDATVFPSPRGSWRVPFGTGQRVNRFLAGTHNEYEFYSPDSFKVLKDWLQLFNQNTTETTEFYMREATAISPSLSSFLRDQHFEKTWEKICRGPSHQIARQKKIWFDGFRTLKLIHYLRDNGYPPMPAFKAISDLLKLHNLELPELSTDLIPGFEEQQKLLNYMRLHF